MSEDILESIERIERFTHGLDFAAFSANEQVVYAVNHALLILSEAAAKLGEQAQELCPQIVWADIRGLGNRLRHEYANVNLIRIWLIVEKELAPLKAAVAKALNELKPKRENPG